jgi:hypothetical protein
MSNEFGIAQLDWIRAIEETREPQTSGREGLADLASAFAVLESNLAGRRVTVDEVINGDVSDYQIHISKHFEIN